MGIRIDIQKKIIALFKVEEYEVIDYDDDRLPQVTGEKVTPNVECNEVSANFDANVGQVGTQKLRGWTFDLICNFNYEVDYSDFLLSLDNMSYAYNDNLLVVINIGNSILVQHPVRESGSTGSQLRFNIIVTIKK